MTTEAYINGNLIDLGDRSRITATYGSLSFGEMNKRKGVKTNTFTAPFTQRNKLACESCELTSSESLIPYRDNIFRVDIEGVTAFEGFCIIEEANEGYDIQSFAGATDFYSVVTKTKLVELDLSDYSHIWGEAAIRNSWNNVDGYVYAYAGYGKEDARDTAGYPQQHIIPPSHLLPQIFFHSVIKAIADYAGYTISGDVLTDDRFLKHVIIPNKFPLPIEYGGTFSNLSLLLPDLAMSKVWLDFANIYGQQFDVDDVEKEIRCTYIDDLLFNDPEDWTDKVDNTEKQKTKYKIDTYGQRSYLRYKSDPGTDLTGCTQDYAKEIAIDDLTMDPESDVYKSDFYLVQNRLYPNREFPVTKTFNIKNGGQYVGIWDPSYTYSGGGGVLNNDLFVLRNGTYYVATQVSTNKIPGVDVAYWAPKAEKDIWDIKSRAMYGLLEIDLYSPMQVQFLDLVTLDRLIYDTTLDWPTSYQRHYRVFGRIIIKTKSVEKLIKLNSSDINQIRFDTLKQIDGELYALEEITQFKLNEPDSTICKFIRL